MFLFLFFLPALLYKVSLLSVTSTLPPSPLRLVISNLPIEQNFRPWGWHLTYAATSEAGPSLTCLLLAAFPRAVQLCCSDVLFFAKTILIHRDDDMVNAEISKGAGPGLTTSTPDQGEECPWTFWLHKAANAVLYETRLT